MKGSHQRWLDRQERRLNNENNHYVHSSTYLDRLFGNTPSSSLTEERQANLKTGNSYGIVCEDNPNYYRVVFLKRNPYTGSVQPLLSNPTYGIIPDGIQEVTQPQLFRFINFNQNLQNANKAFSSIKKEVVDEFSRWSGGDTRPLSSELKVMDIDNTAGMDEGYES